MLASVIFLTTTFAQAASVAPVTDCSAALARGTGSATALVCLAEAAYGRARAADKNSTEWTRHLEEAASLYKKALTSTPDEVIKGVAIERLLGLFDLPMLNDPSEMLAAFGELIRLRPTDVEPLFRLARYQETQGAVDTAEETLLLSRRVQPNAIEPFKMLAQFYARRAGAIHARATQVDALEQSLPGTPDRNGVYQVGGAVAAPRRLGNAVYPPEAMAAGVTGVVAAEIVVNETGLVSDARVLKSNPVLDEAALKAVREWRFDPVTVDGKPVSVKMRVTVNFAAPR